MEPREDPTDRASGTGLVASPVTHASPRLGRYKLLAELARGGMGVVYVATVAPLAVPETGEPLGRLFVIKELKDDLAEDALLVSLFVEEARLSKKLYHPNVVETLEVGTQDGRSFIALEFLDGQSLNRVLSRGERAGRPLPLQLHLQILSSMLEGLHYAHELTDEDGRWLGLVHRDVSPHNLFVAYDGGVKVLDFGIAKALDSSHHTRTGVLKGKIVYMSPEQAAGAPVDRRTDVFAAGIMLWEAVVGERMWGPVPHDLQILRALRNGNLPKVRERKPDVDEALAVIVDRATAHDLADRYATAEEFQASLDEYLRRMPVAHFGPSDIGDYVAHLFGDERDAMRRVIEGERALLRRSLRPDVQSTTVLPRLRPDDDPPGTVSATAALGPASGSAPKPGPETITDPGHPPRARRDSQPGPVPAATSPHGPLRLVLAGSVALALVALGLLAYRESPTTGQRAPANTGADVPPSETITAVIDVVPAGATVVVDDGPGRLAPYRGTFPNDGRAHAVRVLAHGFEPRDFHFVADSDQKFDLTLKATPAATP